MSTGLVLRDIHQPPAPPWWPPAPGWWVVALVVAAAALAGWMWRRRRARRRARIAALFDEALAEGDTPSARIAAMSSLLRRAARRHHAGADRLEGEAWLALLDGPRARGFVDGAGRVLLDGPFRPDVSGAEADALVPIARARFLEWMGVR